MDESLQSLSDEMLAQRAQAGDWANFEILVRRYEARIFGFCRQCCGNQTDARELTQETFVAAFRHLTKYDPAFPFAAWLFTIARRKCIDRGRRPRAETDAAVPERLDADDPAELLGRREAAEDLWRRARRLLTQTQFQTLWLHYAEDLSVREVARVMRRTQPHIKVLLFRARQRLAASLHQPLSEADKSLSPPGLPHSV